MGINQLIGHGTSLAFTADYEPFFDQRSQHLRDTTFVTVELTGKIGGCADASESGECGQDFLFRISSANCVDPSYRFPGQDGVI
jgi:hypothetical protein